MIRPAARAALLAALGSCALSTAAMATLAAPRRSAPLAASASRARAISRVVLSPPRQPHAGLAPQPATKSLMPPTAEGTSTLPPLEIPLALPTGMTPLKNQHRREGKAAAGSALLQLNRAAGHGPSPGLPAGAAILFDGTSRRRSVSLGHALKAATLALALAYAPLAALPSTLAQDRPPAQVEPTQTPEEARALGSLKDIEGRIEKFARGPWLEPGHKLHGEAVESLQSLRTNLDSAHRLLERGEMELFWLQTRALLGWTRAGGPETMDRVLSADGKARGALARERARLGYLEDELARLESIFGELRGELSRRSAAVPRWRERIERAQAWLDEGLPGPALEDTYGWGIANDLNHVRRYSSAWLQLGWLRSRLKDSRLSATALTLHKRLQAYRLLDDAEEKIRDGDWRYEHSQAWAGIRAEEIRSAESLKEHRLRTLAICWVLFMAVPLVLLRLAARAAFYRRRARDILAGRGPEFAAAAQKRIEILAAEVERTLAQAGAGEEAGKIREELAQLREAFSPESLAAADSRLAPWAKDLAAESRGLGRLWLVSYVEERNRFEAMQASLEVATCLRNPDGGSRRMTLDWEGLHSWAESLRSRLEALRPSAKN